MEKKDKDLLQILYAPARNTLPPVPVGEHELILPYSTRRAALNPKRRKWNKLTKQQKTKWVVSALVLYVGVWFLLTKGMALLPMKNTAWVLYLEVFFYVFLFACLATPSHVQLGAQGLRLHWLYPVFGLWSSPWLAWDRIEYISLYTKKAWQWTLLSDEQQLRLQVDFSRMPRWAALWWRIGCRIMAWKQGNAAMITLDAFTHEDDIPRFMQAVKFFAGDKCDPDAAAWQAAIGQGSFTRLWLTQLGSGAGDSLEPLQPGQSLMNDEYRIVAQIAKGGQAITYVAEHSGTGDVEKVAVKEFFLPLRGGKEIAERALKNVEHEASVLNDLSHPQIVRFIDTFVCGSRAYLVTELIRGVSLRKHVQEHGAFAEEQVIGMARQLCDILSYLHSQTPPLIHRDLTPDNLILKDDGTIVLIDFNVAQRLESANSHTVVGKQCYISPEQFRGNAGIESDIYSLGCVMFWLLTGSDPEPISTSRPRSLAPHLSAWCDDIVARATQTDATKRYASADDVLADILADSKEPSINA